MRDRSAADHPLVKQSTDLDPPAVGSSRTRRSNPPVPRWPWWQGPSLPVAMDRSRNLEVPLQPPAFEGESGAVDLLGRGGIVVNGASVRSRRIDDGDELRIGLVLIRFRWDINRTPTSPDPLKGAWPREVEVCPPYLPATVHDLTLARRVVRPRRRGKPCGSRSSSRSSTRPIRCSGRRGSKSRCSTSSSRS